MIDSSLIVSFHCLHLRATSECWVLRSDRISIHSIHVYVVHIYLYVWGSRIWPLHAITFYVCVHVWECLSVQWMDTTSFLHQMWAFLLTYMHYMKYLAEILIVQNSASYITPTKNRPSSVFTCHLFINAVHFWKLLLFSRALVDCWLMLLTGLSYIEPSASVGDMSFSLSSLFSSLFVNACYYEPPMSIC